jgi:oxygen-independent coproporphyrinogen-3 oxidase
MLSLYVHIPFCVRKCHYCGFYSTTQVNLQSDEYLDALRLETAGYRQAFDHRVFETVYIGGGTPTVLSSEQLNTLISTIREHFHVSRDAEWTIEANPNTVFLHQFSELRESGINRLSLGVQSFNDGVLQTLGRLHSAESAAKAFWQARSSGFSNIGVDLMYGVPGQTADAWSETLDIALSLEPEHVSAYSLSIDEGSRFMKEAVDGRFVLPGDEQTAAMYEFAVENLSRAGYDRYEISNFCRPGFACRHNLNYWQRGEYLGLGPSAWSFISGRRYRTVADVRTYAERLNTGLTVVEDEEKVDLRQAANETIMLGLRTAGGLDLEGISREFGAGILLQLEKNAAPLKQDGLLEGSIGRLRLTERGFLLANEALARLVL